MDAIAVTHGPGLAGSLLVGVNTAKGMSLTSSVPLLAINHLEGHINSVFLQPDSPPFPFVALLASGGHTSIYHVVGHTTVELMGQTRDEQLDYFGLFVDCAGRIDPELAERFGWIDDL